MRNRIFTMLVVLLLALGLSGCPPEEAYGDLGEAGVLRFAYQNHGPVLQLRLATGSSASLFVDTETPLTFSSSDPAIFEATADGTVTGAAPGSAPVIASNEAGEELDRIALTVADATAIEVMHSDLPGLTARTAIFPGFEYRVGVRLSDDVGALVGAGGYEVTPSEGLAVRAARPDEGGFYYAGNVLVLSGSTPGIETLTVSSAHATTTQTFRIAGADEIDVIEELGRTRSGSGADGSVAIRLSLHALSGGEDVAGAPCAWTVDGAEIGLDNVQPGGELMTDFWTTQESFSATCNIGSATQTFDVVVADVAEY